MAKPSLIEQLDSAVEALLARPGREAPPAPYEELAALVRIAADLRELPREGFKARLKSDLQRRNLMASGAKAVPQQAQSVTAYLCFKDAAAAIEFYKKALGAVETMRLTQPDGRIGHAQIRIGNSTIMLSDEFPDFGAVSAQTLGGSPVRINLQVSDVDAVVAQAVAQGAKIARPVQDQFYGARSGQITDPFGYAWTIATHTEDVPADELQRRFDAITKGAGEGAASGQAPAVSPIPEGFRTITPYIMVEGGSRFIEFLTKAFGAKEHGRVPRPDGKLMHAEVRLLGGTIELADSIEEYPASPVSNILFVDDADAMYKRALEAGAASLYAPVTKPYGDREAAVRDPFGNRWWISTRRPSQHHPADMQAVTPGVYAPNAKSYIEFLKTALGAEETYRAEQPDGSIKHSVHKIGDSYLTVSDAHDEYQPESVKLHLYVRDTDAAYNRAMAAGATSLFVPEDKPYGDRSGGVKDPLGNLWYFSTRIKEMKF